MFRFLCILTVLLLASPSWADELKTLANKTITGTLESITDKEIVLKTTGGEVKTPLMQVLDVTLRSVNDAPKAEKYIEVQLFDDSILRCTKVKFGAKDLEMELTTGPMVKVPLTAFVSMVRDAQDSEIKRQWRAILASKTRGDRIVILSAGNLNSIAGTLNEINEAEGTIKFKRDKADPADIKLDRLHGMIFQRTDVPVLASLCRVIDVDGSTLVAATLSFDGKKVSVDSPSGSKVKIDIANLARLDFNFGRLTYLSDLDAKITSAPLLGGFGAMRKDTNLDGDSIMLAGKPYAKGLSMYAGNEVEYDLNGKYKDFKATLGADATIAEEGQGKVTVTIYCDQRKVLAKEVSATLAENIAINVKDVNSLRIVVSGTNFTNLSGHAVLANAHVSQ